MNDEPGRAPFDELEHEELHDEATVVVRRLDDETVVVDRTGPGEAGGELHGGTHVDAPGNADADADEATVVVARAPEPDESTVVVDRSGSEPALVHQAAPVMHAPTRRGRRRPAPAPVSEEVLRTAEPGAGVGVLDRYEVREPEASVLAVPPRFEPGPPPSRDTSLALPSVARRTRRAALVSIAVFAVACLVSLAGLTAIVAVVLGELLG